MYLCIYLLFIQNNCEDLTEDEWLRPSFMATEATDSDPDSDENNEATDFFTALKHRKELQKNLAIAEAKVHKLI